MAKAGRQSATAEQVRRVNLAAIFDQIREAHGRLSPSTVVRAAASEEHPLHPSFEWNDATAAHQHRLNQARAILRLPRTTVVIEGCRIISPTYVHDPGAKRGEQGYVAVAEIKTQTQVASDAVDAELERAAGALKRAQGIASALGDIATIEATDQALRAIGRR